MLKSIAQPSPQTLRIPGSLAGHAFEQDILKPSGRICQLQGTDVRRSAAYGMDTFSLQHVVADACLPQGIPVGKMFNEQTDCLPPEIRLIEHALDRADHVETIKRTGNGHRTREVWKKTEIWEHLKVTILSRYCASMLKNRKTFPFLYIGLQSKLRCISETETMRQTALIVEDDPGTRHVLGSTLATAGIESIFAENGATMWRRLEEKPDVIILDLSLPDVDGLELLRQLRQTSEIPVLIHSTRSDEIERIIGIEIGADDFLPKPCNMRELLARIRGLLRRCQRPTVSRSDMRRLVFGDWTLDTASRELSRPGSTPTSLGVSGYALLAAFLEHPFEPLSREQLSRVLKREYVPYDRIIDVHVSQIRRILGKQVDGTGFIKTLRSQGYVFIAPVEMAS